MGDALDGSGEVVRVAGVRPDGDHRGRVRDQPFLVEPAHHLLLQPVFVERAPLADGRRGGRERPILDPVQGCRRRPVRVELGRRPHRLERLDEIARRHDVHAAGADRFRSPGVDPRDIGDGATGRVLHRDGLDPAQQVREPRFELLAAAVDQFLARQGVEVVPLDRVHQRPGLTLARESGSTSGAWSDGRRDRPR